MNSNLSVLRKSANQIKEVNLCAAELEKNIIWISGNITEDLANDFIRKMMAINMNPTNSKPIKVFITTNGGSVDAGLVIYDTIQSSKLPVYTIAIEKAYSMGAIILAAGEKRFIFPHSKVMIHQPIVHSGLVGNIDDLNSITEHLLKTNDKLIHILAEHTNKTLEEIQEATKYDHYFTADEAIEFGLVDKQIGFNEMMNEL